MQDPSMRERTRTISSSGSTWMSETRSRNAWVIITLTSLMTGPSSAICAEVLPMMSSAFCVSMSLTMASMELTDPWDDSSILWIPFSETRTGSTMSILLTRRI